MATNPTKFPFIPGGDSVIIERLNIKSKVQKKAEQSKIILQGGSEPKNIVELENKKMREMSQYDNAESELLAMWDEHPNQGIIMAVGEGRYLEEGVKIPMTYKKGQHVYYRGRSGDPIIINKKLYWVIKEHDIFGVSTDKK